MIGNGQQVTRADAEIVEAMRVAIRTRQECIVSGTISVMSAGVQLSTRQGRVPSVH